MGEQQSKPATGRDSFEENRHSQESQGRAGLPEITRFSRTVRVHSGLPADSQAFSGIFTRGECATVNWRELRGVGLSPGLYDLLVAQLWVSMGLLEGPNEMWPTIYFINLKMLKHAFLLSQVHSLYQSKPFFTKWLHIKNQQEHHQGCNPEA